MPQVSPPSSDQRSISELLQGLTTQSSVLAQKEIELAKTEMAQKGKRFGLGAGALERAKEDLKETKDKAKEAKA